MSSRGDPVAVLAGADETPVKIAGAASDMVPADFRKLRRFMGIPLGTVVGAL
jgi:hypothetical protein